MLRRNCVRAELSSADVSGKGGYFNDGLAASGFVSHIDQVMSCRIGSVEDKIWHRFTDFSDIRSEAAVLRLV